MLTRLVLTASLIGLGALGQTCSTAPIQTASFPIFLRTNQSAAFRIPATAGDRINATGTGNSGLSRFPGGYFEFTLTAPDTSVVPTNSTVTEEVVLGGARYWVTTLAPLTLNTSGTYCLTVEFRQGGTLNYTPGDGTAFVTLRPPCTFGLSTATVTAPVAGGDGSVNLSLAGGGCVWSAAAPDSWLGVYPLGGTADAGAVSVTWTASPNFTTQTRTSKVTIGGQTLTVTQAGNTLTSAQRFVQLLYWSFFGRLPTQAELDFQTAGGLSRPDLALNFWNSEEFFIGGRYAAGVYVGILDRDSEFGGWLFQRRTLATRVLTQEQLVSNFLAAGEYALKFGTLSNDGFVRQMYTQVLFRDPTNEEVAFHVGSLTGGASRAAVARAFLGSGEFRIGTAARLTTSLLYFTLLQRDVTPADRAWVASMSLAGIDLRTLVTAVLNSTEFAAALL